MYIYIHIFVCMYMYTFIYRVVHVVNSLVIEKFLLSIHLHKQNRNVTKAKPHQEIPNTNFV